MSWTGIDAAAHLSGVSLAAVMPAKRRGLELAAMTAMLHDLRTCQNGSCDGHALQGAALAWGILGAWGWPLRRKRRQSAPPSAAAATS
ncbi:MAG: hypothetical protein HFG01_01395 [Oscillibacter sp.]|nr:hypothetical protein [Oscillibacter sp.]